MNLDRICPADALAAAIAAVERDPRAAVAELQALCARYPDDARILFLQGSNLAGLGEIPAAIAAMSRAVAADPDFRIARFQLGLLRLTEGAAQEASEAWAPLAALSPEDPLRLFAAGLQALSRDDFVETERLLRAGLARNAELPQLNADMQLILERLPSNGDSSPTSEPTSVADWLLRQPSARPTRH